MPETDGQIRIKVNLDTQEIDKDMQKLQEKLDKIFGKEHTDERSLQDTFEDLGKTKLADHGEIAMDLEDIVDDLLQSPESMDSDQLSKTLNDIDKLMNDIEENSDALAGDFNKPIEDIHSDAENARKALKDAMRKMQKGGLSKDEKKELIDKAKDALEDIISDDAEKEKLKEKRAERDKKREEEKKKRLKKTHPLRNLIIIFKNLAELYEIKLISEETRDIINKCIDDIELLTEKKFSEMKKIDMKNLVDHLNELYDPILADLVKLIENETILQKTKEDMEKILDDVFETILNALKRIFDPGLDDSAKGSLIKSAAMKLRTIGKLLKTQKKWRVGDEFKAGYIDEMKRLMELRKEGGDEALFKELYDKGVISPMMLDEHGLELLSKLAEDGEISGGTVGSPAKEVIHMPEPIRYTDELKDAGIKPYKGTVYYNIFENEDAGGTVIELSDNTYGLPDDADIFTPIGLRFEKDFPEYRIGELMEAVFEVCYVDTFDSVDFNELKEKLEANPNYKEGDWDK